MRSSAFLVESEKIFNILVYLLEEFRHESAANILLNFFLVKINIILWIDILMILFTSQGTAADTSIGASTIALYILIPFVLMIITALLLWIMRLKKKGINLYFIKK